MLPSAATNGIGYVAPRPSGMTCSVQAPSIECGAAERATTSAWLCRLWKTSRWPSRACAIVG